MNRTIGIISGSNKRDGIQVGMKVYQDVLSRMYNVNWYQCSDPSSSNTFGIGTPIIGLKFPNIILEMGINRMFVFRSRFRPKGENMLILADLTLLQIPKKLDNVVVRVHDLRPLTKYSDNYLTKLMYKFLLRKLRKVRGAITSTEWMREQIMKYMSKNAIVLVVPDAHSMPMRDRQKIDRSIQRIQSGQVNITYIATDRPYKNIGFFLNLAEMMSRIGNLTFAFHLVSKLKESTVKKLKDKPIRNLLIYENIEDVKDIYANTDIYIQPSLYEGFGRPIIEAMSQGIPVIANSIEPFFEIMDGAGMIISLENPSKWISAIQELSDPINYRIYANRSIVYSEKYSLKNFEEKLSHAINEFLPNTE